MIIGTQLNKATFDENYDAIVIGSGIGGLCTAAILAKKGQKVLVLEKHYTAGGFTHTYKRKGFEWDVGVHYIGEVHRPYSPLRTVFDYITDGNLKWHKMDDVYDKVNIGDEEFSFRSGRENLQNDLIQRFPEEEEAIKKYISLVRQINRDLSFFFLDRIVPKFVGTLLRKLTKNKFRQYSQLTVHEVLESLTSNELLKAILTTQMGDYGHPPKEASFAMHAVVVKHYFDGASYPVGGSSSIAAHALPVIEKPGGQVVVSAGVSKVLIEDNAAYGVELENGQTILGKKVVSGVGVLNTFNHLLDQKYKEEFGFNDLTKSVKPSLAHICIYIGLDKSVSDLGIKNTNRWIYPTKDYDKNFADYTSGATKELPLTYISFPSAKDPEWMKNHPNKGTVEVLGLAPFEWFEKWKDTKWRKRGDDYLQYKEEMGKDLLEVLYKHVPEVKGHIAYSEISTPLSTKTFCYYEHGEIYGLEHTKERFLQDRLRPKTSIENFYLTGQDIITAGVGAALISGVFTVIVMEGIIKSRKLISMITPKKKKS
ncbi:MAG: NAD(P)/FAD-dependent oxidoreductase [Bacteriovoracaceae bacterium]|nr:NAD(P)/FAD-dependent oxidoreductase [Bacteriovoracaceae bacterium]